MFSRLHIVRAEHGFYDVVMDELFKCGGVQFGIFKAKNELYKCVELTTGRVICELPKREIRQCLKYMLPDIIARLNSPVGNREKNELLFYKLDSAEIEAEKFK